MRRSAITGALLALVLAAAAAPAGAATLTVDRPCYRAGPPGGFNGQTVALTGSGFTPNSQVTLTLGGEALQPPLTSDGAGAVAGSFPAPSLAGRRFGATRTLSASDGANQAGVPVVLRRLAADFLPGDVGSPRQRVRFYVYGFGARLAELGRSTAQPVYQHVLDPAGRRRATFLLGRPRGPCGDLRTAPRSALPFRRLNAGLWRFVFTTRVRYSARSDPQAFVGLRLRLIFRRPG
ncbi:MAG TPA: hypothetical protein VNB64_12135 [Solirubrobacteraceae bacterium]|nr:hypothetical protein [Solirubrobacteraceae bacterium]